MFDALKVFLKGFFEKVDFEKNPRTTKQHRKCLNTGKIVGILYFFKHW